MRETIRPSFFRRRGFQPLSLCTHNTLCKCAILKSRIRTAKEPRWLFYVYQQITRNIAFVFRNVLNPAFISGGNYE